MNEYVFRHPFKHDRCVQRLIDEYNEHHNLIVAFDFDSTIFDYHNNGGNYSEVIELLAKCSKMNFILVLFTSNDDPKKLEWMVAYCNHFNIKVNYINESPVLHTKKPYYNILLDDRAGLEETYCQLMEAISIIVDLNFGKEVPMGSDG